MTAAAPLRATDAEAADVELTLQQERALAGLPDEAFFAHCVALAAAGSRERVELTLRVVDEDEGRALNLRWRARDYATNVLSFPTEGLAEIAPDLIGDIVLCAPVVYAEAAAQGKSAADHFAHLTVHGVLHLLGFDHEDDASAAIMEQHERAILAAMGIADPYRA